MTPTRPSAPPTRRRRARPLTPLALVGSLALLVGVTLGGCGSQDTAPRLSGQVRTPPTQVGDASLPDASNQPFSFHAAPGELLLVYFGYTSCPDVCPTTLSDIRAALRKLDPRDAERVQVAMVTIDPARDDPSQLAAYLDSFVTGGVALSTTDDTALRAVADRFGASYSVETNPAGEVEVSHSAFLYAVDDQGNLSVQWPFGVHSPELAKDLQYLVDQQKESS